MPDNSVLVASNYNAWREPFNNQAFEFLDVITSVENARLIAPPERAYTKGRKFRATPSYLATELVYRSVSGLGRRLGRPRLSSMEPVTVDQDCDLFFFMCQSPYDLSALNQIKNWRERSRKAAVFVLESWSSLFGTCKAELRLLDKFDHVFVLNSCCIPRLNKYTSTPCSFLATAADCLLATPFPDPPERTVDVYSMGRRSPSTHEQLIRKARNGDLFYLYDVWNQGIVQDWRESRLLTTSIIKRSKFFIAYDHTIGHDSKLGEAATERSISTRYFEGAAGGAVMIGTAPNAPEFLQYFDWEDALIEIPRHPDDIGAILADLCADPQRLARISRMNAIQSLRRHDWAYRWEEVLKTFGMDRSPKLDMRIEKLRHLSDEAEWVDCKLPEKRADNVMLLSR